MYLQLEFVDAGRGYNHTLATGQVFVGGFGLSHKLEETPLASPCQTLEFNLYDGSFSRLEGENLKSEFAKSTLSRTLDASYHHRLKLTHTDHPDGKVSLREYVEFMAEQLAEDNQISKDRLAVIIKSYPLNGDFQDVLKSKDGTFQSQTIAPNAPKGQLGPQ